VIVFKSCAVLRRANISNLASTVGSSREKDTIGCGGIDGGHWGGGGGSAGSGEEHAPTGFGHRSGDFSDARASTAKRPLDSGEHMEGIVDKNERGEDRAAHAVKRQKCAAAEGVDKSGSSGGGKMKGSSTETMDQERDAAGGKDGAGGGGGGWGRLSFF